MSILHDFERAVFAAAKYHECSETLLEVKMQKMPTLVIKTDFCTTPEAVYSMKLWAEMIKMHFPYPFRVKTKQKLSTGINRWFTFETTDVIGGATDDNLENNQR
jgi:hypothetical protein